MSNELTKLSEMPSFLQEFEGPKGTEELAQIIVPSRLKVWQPLSKPIEGLQCNDGDVVLLPENKVLLEYDSEFSIPFTPVVFFREFTIWNPLKLQGQLPFIRERSTDPEGEIAQRAKDPDARREPCPERPDEDLRYMAHLNWLVMLHIENAPILPVIMTFVSGEFKKGQRFANLILARNAPMYGCVFEFSVSRRENSEGFWYGFDITNGSDPWVDPDEFDVLKNLHIDLQAKVAADQVQADYESAGAPYADVPEDQQAE